MTRDEAKSIILEHCFARIPGISIEIVEPPPPEPEWFNPDNVTPEQVGASEGWRLLTVDEVSDLSREYPETQWYRHGAWECTGTWCACREGRCTLRTKRPIGYYKPQNA